MPGRKVTIFHPLNNPHSMPIVVNNLKFVNHSGKILAPPVKMILICSPIVRVVLKHVMKGTPMTLLIGLDATVAQAELL